MEGNLIQNSKWVLPRSVFTVLLALGLGGNWSAPALDTRLSISPAATPPTLTANPTIAGIAPSGALSLTATDPLASAIAARLKQLVLDTATSNAAVQAQLQSKRNTAQQNAIRLLRERAGQDLEVHLRSGNRTVMQIHGAVLERPTAGIAAAAAGAREQQTARNFLRVNRDLLRLDDPDSELAARKPERDDTGCLHLKFDQSYHGIPVWPSGLSVHLDAIGNVYLADGAYVPTPTEAAAQPVLTAAEAAARAQASVEGGNRAQATVPTLIIYAPLDQRPRLAWKLDVSVDLLHAWLVIVDALDGRILDQITKVLDANVVGSGKDLRGATRTINVWSAGGKFYMADTTKAMFNPAFDPIQDPHGVITILDAREATEQQLKTVFDVDSMDANAWTIPDAVSASFNFSLTYDYYLERHNRNSLDGNGGTIKAIVRVGQLDNAFWSGDVKAMFFGNARPYAAGLDVIGHELTHGVTQNSADLIYEFQSGALNEAMSDIFGELVEARRDGQPDWLIGEEIPFVIRDFKNPGSIKTSITGQERPLPAKMSELFNLPNTSQGDHGGVHINSSIINHAFYLLAEGLTGAVGLRDAEKIFYRALTQHLQKQSQFIDARLGCVASAQELFGTNTPQLQKVKEAFDAVEIFDTPSTPEPSPIPTVQAPDSTLLISFDPSFFEIALGRREARFGDPIDGVALVESVKEARPAVSGDGSFALFVDSANDMCGVNTDNPNSLQCLGFRGLVQSVAVAPNSKLFAFVLRDPITGQPLNKINVYNVANNSTKTFNLLSPVVDGTSVDTVLYADEMVFTADSKVLIYDALAQIKFGSSAPVQRWSIFAINLETETATVLLPPQEGFDVGNPNIGRAGNRYLTFDARDATTGNTKIINLDLFTGDYAEVGSVGQGVGYPCFTGDESAVIFAARDASATFTGFSLVKQTLAANRLTKSGAPTLWLPDATIGVIYRRGTFTSSNALPQVRLLSPSDGQTFPERGSFVVEATASDTDGQIAKVEFYEGSAKLLELTAPPYRFSVDNAASRQFRFIARAIDNLGGATDSAPVTITVGQVNPSPIKLSAAKQSNNAIRLTLTAAAGNYFIQQSTNLTQWADVFPVTVGAAGSATVDDTAGPANNRLLFYRARKP